MNFCLYEKHDVYSLLAKAFGGCVINCNISRCIKYAEENRGELMFTTEV